MVALAGLLGCSHTLPRFRIDSESQIFKRGQVEVASTMNKKKQQKVEVKQVHVCVCVRVCVLQWIVACV